MNNTVCYSNNDMKKRYEQYDNFKGILILLVVVGHLCEIMPFQEARESYAIIYLFHMPAFIFLSGMFGKFDVKRILKHLVLPYFVFQTLYLLFAREVLGTKLKFQYHKPYWILWYLMAMIWWNLLLAVLALKQRYLRYLIWAISIGLSLWIGTVSSVSYDYTLSRTIVYLPFFLWGYYFKHSSFFEKCQEESFRSSKGYRTVAVLFAVLATIAIAVVMMHRSAINAKWFYGAYPYEKLHYHAGIRGGQLVAAAVIIVVVLMFLPEKKIPVLGTIGQRTMPIFLLHGFVIRYMKYAKVWNRLEQAGFPVKGGMGILFLLFLAAGIVALIMALTCLWDKLKAKCLLGFRTK